MAKKPNPPDTQDFGKTAQVADGASVDLRILLGRNLQRARLRAGLSEADVQIQVGFDETTLAGIEKGEVDLRLKRLVSLADVLGEDVASLLRPPTENIER